MKKINFVSRYTAFFLVTVLFSGALSSCKDDDKDLVKPKTITDVLIANSQFSILREIIVGIKMGDALRAGEFTLFAPNDAAFKRAGISASTIISLPRDSAISFVEYHMLPSIYTFSNLKTGNNVAFNKRLIRILKTGDSTITVNRAIIVTKNISADNGVIHTVDRLLTEK